MRMGPFRVRVSKQAERLDFNALPSRERGPLGSGLHYDEARHAVFRFYVFLDFLGQSGGNKRSRRRRDFALADLLIAQVQSPSTGLRLLRIYPTTQRKSNQPEPDIGGEIKAEVNVPASVKLSISGVLKDLIRREPELMVIAQHNDLLAQWLFLKPYLDSGQEFRMLALCELDGGLPPSQRYLRCHVSVQAKGREIEAAYHRRILLPDSGAAPTESQGD